MKSFAISLGKKGGIVFIGMALIMTMLSGLAFSQADPETEELAPTSLAAAKTVLQKMGISLQSELGKASSIARTWVFSAKITDPEKAFKSGFQVKSSAGMARVAGGTEIFLALGARGKITLFVDSQNNLRSQTNELLSVFISKSQLASGVEVVSSSFPAFTR